MSIRRRGMTCLANQRRCSPTTIAQFPIRRRRYILVTVLASIGEVVKNTSGLATSTPPIHAFGSEPNDLKRGCLGRWAGDRRVSESPVRRFSCNVSEPVLTNQRHAVLIYIA